MFKHFAGPYMSQRAKGRIERNGDFLSLSFGWSKQKFEIVKRLGGSFYCKESKSWKVPLRHLSTLEKSRYFSDVHFEYLFDRQVARKDIAAAISIKGRARAAVEQDPFFVPRDVLLASEADIAVILAPSGVGVEFVLSQKAKGSLSNIEGAHPVHIPGNTIKTSQSDRYFLPVMNLRKLIALAKEEGLFFGVEQQAGESLKETAIVRSRVQLGYTASTDELEKSHMIPIVTTHLYTSFRILHIDPQQLKDCFPRIRSLEEKRRKADCITLSELFDVFASIKTKPIKLWLSKEAVLVLKKQTRYLSQLHA